MAEPWTDFTSESSTRDGHTRAERGGAYATGWTTDPRTGQAKYLDSPQARGYESEGKVQEDTAWGGYATTVHRDENGNFYTSPMESGRQEDVDRYQGMAAAAAAREAYKNNYGLANGYGDAALRMRNGQTDAGNLYRDAALGRNSQAQALGQNMLAQGLNAQQAGAMSTRGGSLAQAAAMRSQQAGQGAFMQRGNAQLQALQAQEMASGRAGYMGAMSAARAGDQTAQGLHQQQSLAQMQNEMHQRELNQKAQQGYEGLAFDVNKQSQNANLTNQEINSGVQNTIAGINAADKARDMRLAGAGVGAVASMGTSLIGKYGGR